MPKIFISYRRGDSQAIAGRIRDRLANKYGEGSVFMDVDSISDGSIFFDEIKGALQGGGILLAIIGPDWQGPAGAASRIATDADPVRIEIETALQRGIHVIPVLVNGAGMPKAADLPPSLQSLLSHNAAEVDAGRDFHQHMERLIRSIDRAFLETAPWWSRYSAPGLKYAALALLILLVLRFAYDEYELRSGDRLRIDEFFSCGARVLYPGVAFNQVARTEGDEKVHVLAHVNGEAVIRLYSGAVRDGDTISSVIDQFGHGAMVSYRVVRPEEFGILTGWRASPAARDAQEEFYLRLQMTTDKRSYILYEMIHPPKDQSNHPYWNLNEIISRSLFPKAALPESPRPCDFRRKLAG
jgi:hypothetical protein